MSGIFFFPEAVKGGVDGEPLVTPFVQGLFAVLLEGIVFALPTGLGLGPAGFDETAVFQAVEDGVKHAVGPLDFVFGEFLNVLDDGVAIRLTLGKEGKDEGFGGGGDEFFGDHKME
jgi:hypothetical protein